MKKNDFFKILISRNKKKKINKKIFNIKIKRLKKNK